MGELISPQETFEFESKSKFDPFTSLHSVDHASSNPAADSTTCLWEGATSRNEQKWRPGARDWVILFCVIILATMDAFNSTLTITMLPRLANEFDKPLISTIWVTTIYLVLGAIAQLFFTMLSDVFNQGLVWLAAALLSAVGTGICSGSSTLTVVIVGRMLQGIGGGGALALCFVVVQETTPQSIHSRYSCWIQLAQLFGFMLGPIIGGLIADNMDWRTVFYLNYIFCCPCLMVIPVAFPFSEVIDRPRHESLRNMRKPDWSGATMASVGLTGILVGVGCIGTSYGWDNWQIWAPIALGILAIIVLISYEAKWACCPQFGAEAFRDLPTIMTYVGCFCHGFVFICQLQIFTLYFMCTRYFPAIVSGVALFGITGFAATPAAVVGILLARDSYCSKWIISGGWMLTTAIAGCSILLNSITPTVGWVMLLLTAGLGHGLLFSSYNIRIQNMPTNDKAAFSTQPTSISIFARTWGMAFAIPIGVLVFLTCFGNQLQIIGLSLDLTITSRGYLALMNQVIVSENEREAIKHGSVFALQVIWEVIAGVAAFGGISSIFLWRSRESYDQRRR
ncbi:Major facilitator superfamily domain general substrate transporter [Penicillium angulare]|uniref:Major facilitator superfamily domain general substrate transporter n=1 Tax=Penicillium angulare TaxID=116970 RepID=A0A9W9FVS8_9EURO|nr:Major facilitator superfamily domain general substrate transporter [Penicillium angulare]